MPEKVFNLVKFCRVRLGSSGQPHTQDGARDSDNRRDLIKTKIGIFNKPRESHDQCRLTWRLLFFLGVYNSRHESVHWKKTVVIDVLFESRSKSYFWTSDTCGQNARSDAVKFFQLSLDGCSMKLGSCLLAVAVFLFLEMPVSGEVLPHPIPVISFAMPDEVDAPVDPEADADRQSLMTIPGAPSSLSIGRRTRDFRGVPDETKKIGDFSDPDTKVVWGTWKADYELFQREEAEPTEWSSFDGFTPCGDLPFKGSGRTMVLGSFLKFPGLQSGR